MNEQGQQRIYNAKDVVAFCKTTEPFGGLSNMAAGYSLFVLDRPIQNVEALYQACRFPQNPEIQNEIVSQTSPMSAKIVSRHYLFSSQTLPA